ncbi:tRNA (5-methylaminomethyl-2-thiouridine)(34)-methyltransferase MnmD [Nibrella saemangeumensis]|uniref:tRNA (5-methylaminomethyl-2-thiouridine)(34)-methyltransferase MnmD n=1 Tax=Nibrella saemangeumensis TaxID=1084526 RepID=A0ABP8MF88_9BACT
MKTDSRIVVTADGSHSVYHPVFAQHYHSIFGAWQESQRVFIELGLEEAFRRFDDDLFVFEMGFGTGLNALLTAREAGTRQRPVFYTAVEAYPLPMADAQQLNFDTLLGTNYLSLLHEAPWDGLTEIHSYFTLTKRQGLLQDIATGDTLPGRFHLVYYDAFAPEAQPELWTEDIFKQIAALLRPGGLLVTYCSKGYVQRNLKAAGFSVEKHPGPARKREVLRAVLK